MMPFGLLFWLWFFSAGDQRPRPPAWLPDPAGALQTYQQTLTQLRRSYPTKDSLPDLKFFLFGMGNRMKLIYRSGRLLNARTGNIEWQWDVQREIIVPSEYTVQLSLHAEPGTPPQLIQIREDEAGVWLLQTGKRTRLIRGTRSPLHLPRFDNLPNGPVLRVLLQEVLMNVMNGKLLTNFFVYNQPDAGAISPIVTVLQLTGNDQLVAGRKSATPDSTRRDDGHERNGIGSVDYPLSWQRNAPDAHYPGLTVLEKTLVKQRLMPLQAQRAASLFLNISGQR